MTETIPGGAYKNPDGSWHDANGKPLPAQVVRKLEEPLPQSVTIVTPPPPPTEPENIPGMEGAEEVKAPKRSARRS